MIKSYSPNDMVLIPNCTTGLGNIDENGAIKGGEWAGYGPYGECREALGLGCGYDVEKRECETEEVAHAC